MKNIFYSCLTCSIFLAVPAAAQQEIVAKYRSEYPTPMSAEQKVDLLRHVAVDVKGGLLVKRDRNGNPEGNNCLGYACDIICFSDAVLYDVLEAEGETARPAWGPTSNPRGYRCELQAAIPEPPPPPAPAPPPVVASCDLGPLTAQLQEVLSREIALQQDLADHTRVEEAHWQNVKSAWQTFLGVLKNPAVISAVGAFFAARAVK